MTRCSRAMLALAVTLASTLPVLAESRWTMQYLHDEDKSTLAFVDIKFSSPRRGMAVGFLQVEKKKPKPAAMITSDGGAHWTHAVLPDEPRSVFLLDDSAAYLVGDSGLWQSLEGGRDWKRILKNKNLIRVSFTDAQHGYVVGAKMTVLQTSDGGVTWKDVPIAKQPSATPERTAYNWIDFWTREKGLIVGQSVSPVRSFERIPIWMDTDPEFRREVPGITIFLQTSDGGATWKYSQNTIFGTLSRFVVAPSGLGIALIEYTSFHKVPSEVLKLDEKTKSFTTAYSDVHRHITDVALTTEGTAFAVGVEVPGSVAASPIPQKVRAVESRDMKAWSEIKVDYRATATRVHLAEAGGQLWMATDTGMILKLTPQ